MLFKLDLFKLILLLLIYTPSTLRAQEFQWVKTFDSTNYSDIVDFDIDSNGNIYCIGTYDGYTDFDPDPYDYDFLYCEPGRGNVFIVKLDADGNYSWVKDIGSNYVFSDIGKSIEVDENDDIIVAGQFYDTVNFGSEDDPYYMTSEGGIDTFICKYNNKNKLLWAKQIKGTGSVHISELKIKNSHFYIIGTFSGSIIYDINDTQLTFPSQGYSDIYVAKYDLNGDFIWIKTIGSTNNDDGYSIAIDDNENFYITGGFWGDVDFDTSSEEYLLHASAYNDIFIAKYNSSGELIFAKGLNGDSYSDFGKSIKIGSNGNLYLTGSFSGTVDFDPGSNSFELTSQGSLDIFIAKYNPEGDFIWAGSIGDSGRDSGNSIAVDEDNNAVYITGFFEENPDFDPGSNNFELQTNGGYDIFFMKLNTDGQFQWAGNIGEKSESIVGIRDCGYEVLVQNQQIFLAGAFDDGSVDFDITTNDYIYTNVNDERSAFICKYSDDKISGIENINNSIPNIYPNPADNKLNIKLEIPAYFTIWSISGIKIYEQHINSNTEIDISFLPTGIYLVKFENEYITKNFKLIKK